MRVTTTSTDAAVANAGAPTLAGERAAAVRRGAPRDRDTDRSRFGELCTLTPWQATHMTAAERATRTNRLIIRVLDEADLHHLIYGDQP